MSCPKRKKGNQRRKLGLEGSRACWEAQQLRVRLTFLAHFNLHPEQPSPSLSTWRLPTVYEPATASLPLCFNCCFLSSQGPQFCELQMMFSLYRPWLPASRDLIPTASTARHMTPSKNVSGMNKKTRITQDPLLPHHTRQSPRPTSKHPPGSPGTNSRPAPQARHTSAHPPRTQSEPPAAARPPATHRKFSIAMRTMEPSTKGPDDCSGRGAGGAELFLLLGTSDEGSLGRGLLEARGPGVDVFLLGVAILASSPPRSSFRFHRPAARAPRRPAPARTAPRATAPASPPRACAVPARWRQRASPAPRLGGLSGWECRWWGVSWCGRWDCCLCFCVVQSLTQEKMSVAFSILKAL